VLFPSVVCWPFANIPVTPSRACKPIPVCSVRSKCHRPKVRINNIINLKLTPDRGLPSRPPNFSIDGLTFEKKCSSNGASSEQGLFFKCASASWFLEEWSEQAAKLFFQNMLQGVSIRFKLRVLRRNASKLPSGNLLVLACQFVCDTMSVRRFAGDAVPLK
jgi:hypothetical protein